MRLGDIYKLASPPQPINDVIIFVGDGFQGEIWSRVLVEEDQKKFWVIQWDPEDILLRILKNNPSKKVQEMFDRNTGRTITRKYPAIRVQVVNEAPWGRRVVVFTDCLGNEIDLINLDKRMVEENIRLEQDNRDLRNEIGFLHSEMERVTGRLDEYLKSTADRVKIISAARWDTMREDDSRPQAPPGEYG